MRAPSLVLLLLLAGCVRFEVTTQTDRSERVLGEQFASLSLGSPHVEGSQLWLAATVGLVEGYEVTTTRTRTVDYGWELVLGRTLRDPDLLDILMIPIGVVGDVLAFVFSAPVEFPRGAIAAIDPGPTRRIESRRRTEPLRADVVTRVSLGGRTIEVRSSRGEVRLEAAEAAAGALMRGERQLAIDVTLRPGVRARTTLALPGLLRLAETRVRQRALTWRRIYQACPSRARGLRRVLSGRARQELGVVLSDPSSGVATYRVARTLERRGEVALARDHMELARDLLRSEVRRRVSTASRGTLRRAESWLEKARAKVARAEADRELKLAFSKTRQAYREARSPRASPELRAECVALWRKVARRARAGGDLRLGEVAAACIRRLKALQRGQRAEPKTVQDSGRAARIIAKDLRRAAALQRAVLLRLRNTPLMWAEGLGDVQIRAIRRGANYHLARYHARVRKDLARAHRHLEAAVRDGFRAWRVILAERDLRELRNSGRIKDLVARYGE